MGVVGVVKRFVHLLAERCETVFPALFPSEVGVVGVKLELYFVLQAIEHCMEHIGVFGKESGVYTYVIVFFLSERSVLEAVVSGVQMCALVASF